MFWYLSTITFFICKPLWQLFSVIQDFIHLLCYEFLLTCPIFQPESLHPIFPRDLRLSIFLFWSQMNTVVIFKSLYFSFPNSFQKLHIHEVSLLCSFWVLYISLQNLLLYSALWYNFFIPDSIIKVLVKSFLILVEIVVLYWVMDSSYRFSFKLFALNWCFSSSMTVVIFFFLDLITSVSCQASYFRLLHFYFSLDYF